MNFYLKLTLGVIVLGLSYSFIPLFFQENCLRYTEINYIDDQINYYKICFASRNQMSFFYKYNQDLRYQNIYKNYYYNITRKELDEENLYMSKSLLSSSSLSSTSKSS